MILCCDIAALYAIIVYILFARKLIRLPYWQQQHQRIIRRDNGRSGEINTHFLSGAEAASPAASAVPGLLVCSFCWTVAGTGRLCVSAGASNMPPTGSLASALPAAISASFFYSLYDHPQANLDHRLYSLDPRHEFLIGRSRLREAAGLDLDGLLRG